MNCSITEKFNKIILTRGKNVIIYDKLQKQTQAINFTFVLSRIHLCTVSFISKYFENIFKNKMLLIFFLS